MRAAIVALSLSVCVVAAGCGQKTDKGTTITIPGKDGSVTVSGGDGQMTMKSSDGKAMMEINSNGLGHANMPDYAPLYPGAKVTASISAANGGSDGSGAMVVFTTSASPADVVGFYKQKATAAGLADKIDASANGSMSFVAGTDKKSISVTAGKDPSGNGTQAEITWAVKP